MILRRLRVERFRNHNLPVEVVFDDRLTVVSGLNEAGKSTLFTALQYAFFRRSSAKGKDIDSLAPWDTQGLSTGVIVEFEHGGCEYRLDKMWGKRAGTTLSRRNAAGTFVPFMETGADEFLAGMFSGQPQKQGAFTGFNGQQLGLAYLLFAPQNAIPIAGEAKDIALNTGARARLTQIVGAAAQSAQEAALCKRIVAETGALFNLKGERRKAKGVRSLSEEIAEIERAIERTQGAVAAFSVLAERLDAAHATHATAVDAARAAKEAAAGALPRYEAAISLDRALCDARREHVDASASYDALVYQCERYERAARETANLEPRRAALAADARRAEAALREATAQRIAASEAFAHAGKADPALAASEAELAGARKACADRTKFEAFNRRLSNAIARDERIEQIAHEAADLGNASRADFETLKALVERERTAACSLDATLTAVSVVAESRLQLTWSSDDCSGEERFAAGERFDAKASGVLKMQIPGVATIEVRGPNADVADLKREQAVIAQELVAFERRVGTRDVLELQRRILTLAALEKERQEKTVERDRLLAGETRAALQRTIDALRASAASAPDDVRFAQLEVSVEEGRAEHAERSTSLATAMASATGRETAAASTVRDVQKAIGKADAARRDLDLEVRALEQTFASHDDRKVALKAAFAARFEAQQRVDAATAAFAPYASEHDPMQAYAELESAANARAQEEHALDVAVVQLRAEAEALYETAPSAELAELEERLEALRVRYEDERLEERAMKLLRSYVDDAEARRVERFAQPILDRVAPWFASVTGRQLSGLDLGADSSLESLRLAGVQRPVRFEELSQGTCDQLALLVRLAYASLLTAPDCLGPMPILLDDPLVNADASRRTRFHRVLESVASGAQVIVFTCRPEEYAELQGTTTTIEACDDRERRSPTAAA